MCDYSLEAVKSRAAVVDETLEVNRFLTATTGFCHNDDRSVAVCVLPGTELAFEEPVKHFEHNPMLGFYERSTIVSSHTTAKFGRMNEGVVYPIHHDAIEFADGTKVLLNDLIVGQKARVLQIPSVVVQVAADRGATEESSEQPKVAEYTD